jgi:hypothetical protein
MPNDNNRVLTRRVLASFPTMKSNKPPEQPPRSSASL